MLSTIAPPRPKLLWLLVAGVFAADLLLPSHWDVAFGYLLAIFLAVSFKEKSDVLLLAVITTVLSIIAAVLKPQEAPLEEMLLERLPAIVAFWATGFLVIRFIALREVEQQQEGRFRALFEHATNGILVLNRFGNIVLANPAAEALFGYESGEMMGKTVESLIPPRFAKHHEAHREYYHQNPRPRSMGIGLDLFGMKKDSSEFPVEISLSPFRTKEGEFVVAFVVDNS